MSRLKKILPLLAEVMLDGNITGGVGPAGMLTGLSLSTWRNETQRPAVCDRIIQLAFRLQLYIETTVSELHVPVPPLSYQRLGC